jgi:putative protease
MKELYTLQNRGYCLGFYDGKPTELAQNYEYTRTLGEWLFAGSIAEWQDNDIIFEVRNYINSGEYIEFLIPNSLDNIRLTLTEFEDAVTSEQSFKVSAGQSKKIRIPAKAFGMEAEKVKKLLPQYSIARKPTQSTPENKKMLDKKKEEFCTICIDNKKSFL